MFGLNRAEVIGRLGADVVINHLVSGGRVANMSIATDESYLDRAGGGERIEKTEWHRVVTFQPGLVDTRFTTSKIRADPHMCPTARASAKWPKNAWRPIHCSEEHAAFGASQSVPSVLAERQHRQFRDDAYCR